MFYSRHTTTGVVVIVSHLTSETLEASRYDPDNPSQSGTVLADKTFPISDLEKALEWVTNGIETPLPELYPTKLPVC